MSIVYRINQERGVAFVVWDGLVTADEWLAHVRRLLADADWPPDRRLHLSDLRTATPDASIDEVVLKQAADLFGPQVANLRAAIVAGDAFEKAGIFERLITRYRPFVFVFNTLNPACGWLGVDVADAQRILESLRAKARGTRESAE
jgi:hypothetical protein